MVKEYTEAMILQNIRVITIALHFWQHIVKHIFLITFGEMFVSHYNRQHITI